MELVVRVLGLLGDSDPETTIRIASRNEKYFKNVQDDFTGDFYWAYGNALYKMNMIHEAMNCYKNCYNVRSMIYGEEDWFTAIAKRELFSCQFNISNGKSGKEILVQFVKNIEDGKYSGIDHDYLKIIEGKTLFPVLMDQSEITDLDEYESLLAIYENICEEYDHSDEPLLKRRLAMNLRGGLFLKTGNYIQARATRTSGCYRCKCRRIGINAV